VPSFNFMAECIDFVYFHLFRILHLTPISQTMVNCRATQKSFCLFCLFLPLLFPLCIAITAQETASVEGRAKSEQAEGLIKLARVALGGEEALGSIQTLSSSAKLRRPLKYVSVQSPKKVVEKEKVLSGKVELDFLLPDRFRKRTSGERLIGFPFAYIEIVNGNRAWRNPPLRAISSHRDSRVIDVDDFERTVESQRRGARQQLTIFSLGLLLKALPTYPLQYSYLGRIKSLDAEANAIAVTDPEKNQMYLLLDPKSNLPLALAWTFAASRQQTVIIEAVGFYNPRYFREMGQRAQRERQERTTPPQRYQMQMKFSDYRLVSRVLLPHRITTTLNQEIIEELTFNEFEINRSINPKKFEGEPEPKY
jgi:hypothetical protein